MTVKEANNITVHHLSAIYPEGESRTISNWVIEHITGTPYKERYYQAEAVLNAEQRDQLDQITRRLLTHEPIQYILQESWFCGLKFYVDRHVLIPRQETEELVEWIISNCRFPLDSLAILDVGTGSGCIPITLKRRLRKAEVWSCDISDQALEVAMKNATSLGVDVHFLQLDFLNKEQRNSLPPFDIIVSNPPYVPLKDKLEMQPNVIDYEPGTALFVTNEDPLVFYKVLAEFGKEKLNARGAIYAEIHEDYGERILQLFDQYGYETIIRKDMQGKDRMVRAAKK
jgi:release factor glutamine methyltransferase